MQKKIAVFMGRKNSFGGYGHSEFWSLEFETHSLLAFGLN